MIAQLSIGLVAGLVASAHCAGMCGGFTIHLTRHSAKGHAAARLALLVVGKAFTYTFLGALAGYAGQWFVDSSGLVDSQRFLAYAAGAVMVLFGLAMVGVRVPALSSKLVPQGGLLADFYASFFRAPGVWSSFALGLMMGFLPCPATLAMLAAAAGTQSVGGGMLVMVGFGLGTGPSLVGVGLGSAALLPRLKEKGLKLAGVVVIVLGLLTTARGSSLIHEVCPSCRAKAAADPKADAAPSEEEAPCPHCQAAEAAPSVEAACPECQAEDPEADTTADTTDDPEAACPDCQAEDPTGDPKGDAAGDAEEASCPHCQASGADADAKGDAADKAKAPCPHCQAKEAEAKATSEAADDDATQH
jgi:uncharacterized protein